MDVMRAVVGSAMYKFSDCDWSMKAPRSRAMSINVCTHNGRRDGVTTR
jgi:hypothetical protein